jgi:uncharacterized membrane protein YedE/YeeE
MGCHDAPMSELPPVPESSEPGASLRIAGFGLAALGGLLMGIGALLPWIRSSLAGLEDAFSPTYYGIDLLDGLLVLAAALVALIALAVARLASSSRARRVAAVVVIAASLAAFVVAGISIVTAEGRFEPTVVDDILADLDPSENATDEQRTAVEDLIETRLAPGPFAVLGGGVLGVVGGVLLLMWARREPSEPAAFRAPDGGHPAGTTDIFPPSS